MIVEFESMEKVKAFFDSPEYRAAREARAGAGVFRMIVTEGSERGPWTLPGRR